MRIEETILSPVFDNAKSFYNKATIKKYYNSSNILVKSELYSYNSLVVTIENNSYKLNYNIKEKLLFSCTTLRHIKDFLKQNYWQLKIEINSKKDIIKYEGCNYYKDIKKEKF